MFCIKCGTKVIDGEVFCRKCGVKIVTDADDTTIELNAEDLKKIDLFVTFKEDSSFYSPEINSQELDVIVDETRIGKLLAGQTRAYKIALGRHHIILGPVHIWIDTLEGSGPVRLTIQSIVQEDGALMHQLTCEPSHLVIPDPQNNPEELDDLAQCNNGNFQEQYQVAKSEVMVCHRCGTELDKKAEFCHKCGTNVMYEDSGDIRREAFTSNDESAKDKFDVLLTKVGPDRTQIIRTVREWTGVELKGAENLTEKLPILLKKNVTYEEAEAIKMAFRKVGADVVFTDQEGHHVEISVHCRVCGAVLDAGGDICRLCGNSFDIHPFGKFDSMQSDLALSGNDFDQGESLENARKEKQGGMLDEFMKLPVFWRWFIGVIAVVVIGFAAWLLIQFLRLIFSSFIFMVVAVAGGYIIYHKGVAEIITEYIYKRKTKELQLPEGMSASTLLETLSGKFNYPYFKGVHYGKAGECVIEGKYSMYQVIFNEDNIAELDYISIENSKKKRTVLLEAMAIRNYINKFFNPALPIDVMKDIKRLKLAEGQRKAVAIVSAAASVLIVAAIMFDYISPGSLQSMVVPGIEVRSAYLSQYSKKVTIEEAFENFFDDCK